MAITTHRAWVYGDDVNTDVIFPGKYTYTLKDKTDIAAHALEDLDPSFASQVQPGDVIVAGRNWGMGSSREQAVTCLVYNGLRAIIAESFGGIYFRNCINQGLHPIVIPGAARLLHTGDVVLIDDEARQVIIAGQAFAMPPLPLSVQAILEAGGLVAMLKQRFQG
ncbi:MAG: 3-isopropylmalate dehydratase [Anaerolineae bacterium]|nr:3-isopropylmalate dehydratase [Anaerolineae bacterium]MDW8172734.1 3-isopropylmalate dehydratase [Anaerolineae bacterium]